METDKHHITLPEVDIQSLKDQAKNYDYIRFTWSDFHGIARGKTVPANVAGGVIEDGVGCFSGSIAFGPRTEMAYVKRVVENNFSNIYAKPVSDKIISIPWAGSGGKYKVGEVICEPCWLDGCVQEANPRYVARKQLNKLKSMGLELMSACEQEFLMLKDGKPYFNGTDYCTNLRFSDVEDIMFEIDQNMQKCGIEAETLEIELAPGQVEMAFKPTFGIKTADSMFRFKTGVKEILKKKGLMAVFMSKPFQNDDAAVGTHFNHSLWYKETGRNAFYDASKEDHFSDLGKYWMGGVFKHMNAITALCCPTVNCYRRLHTPWAPDKHDWDFDNRLVTWRLKTVNEKCTYMENRMPSGSSNIYLVLAATLAAGIDGIKNKLQPPPPGKLADAPSLPNTLEDALNALEKDDVLTEVLGREFIEWFLVEKRTIEIAKFAKHEMKGKKEEEYIAERAEYLEMM